MRTVALAVLAVFAVPLMAQEISVSSVCHPEGGDTYPVGDTIIFEYHPADLPVFPKPPVSTYPPCIGLTLTAEGVTGRPPLTFTWEGPAGLTWSGNPVTIDTGELPAGISTILLHVTNDWGEALDSVNVSIPRLAGPLPAPVPDDAPSPDLQAAFMATAEGAHDWRWDFGDGTTTGWETPCGFATSVATHTFPAPGTYAVVAYARNCRDGAVATEPLEISVGDPNTIRLLRFEAQGCSEAFCVFARDEEINFTVETTAPADHYLYDWDGDGAVDQVTTQSVGHSFPDFGVYTPVLTVERGSASSTLVHGRLILVN